MERENKGRQIVVESSAFYRGTLQLYHLQGAQCARHTFNSKPHFYPGIYLSSHTSTKPHFQQSTLLPSHTYIKHLDTIHYRWHPMGHTSSSCQMFILSFPRHIFHKTKCLECLFFMHCCLNSRYGVGDITPQNHQLHSY